jgi:Protein of unknown function (DUF2934)
MLRVNIGLETDALFCPLCVMTDLSFYFQGYRKEKRMAHLDKTPSHKTASQQARQKTASVPPPAPAGNENKSPRTLSSKRPLTSQEREQIIATMAYLRAEQRGFVPGHEQEDWLQAEAEVDRSIIKS